MAASGGIVGKRWSFRGGQPVLRVEVFVRPTSDKEGWRWNACGTVLEVTVRKEPPPGDPINSAWCGAGQAGQSGIEHGACPVLPLADVVDGVTGMCCRMVLVFMSVRDIVGGGSSRGSKICWMSCPCPFQVAVAAAGGPSTVALGLSHAAAPSGSQQAPLAVLRSGGSQEAGSPAVDGDARTRGIARACNSVEVFRGCAGRLSVALAGPATVAGRACRNCWRLVCSRAGWRGGV